MKLIFNKAAVIASGLVEPERPPPGLAFLCGICEHVGIDHVPFDLTIHVLKNTDAHTAARLAAHAPLYPVTDQELIAVMENLCQSLATEVAAQSPDLVMISVLTYWQNSWTEVLLKALRLSVPDATLLIGGAGPAAIYRDNKSHARLWADQGLLDYYVLGEGDLALPAFLAGETPEGLNHRSDRSEAWVPQIDDLESIPLPSYKKLSMEDYLTLDFASDVSITGSRGCVRRCTFCDVGHYWKKFRYRSGHSIAREIEKHHLDTGLTRFFFTDSLINGSLKSFSDLLDELLILKHQHSSLESLSYYGQFIVRPKNFHKEHLYRKMADTGLRHLQVGIESGSERVREHIGKKFSNEDIDWHLEMCSKYHISNSFLLFVAYPTETRQDFEASKDMLQRYQKYMINDTIIDVSDALPMMLLRGTPMWDMAAELGIETGHDGNENMYSWISTTNPDLSIRERYKRYLEFQRLIMELRYTRAVAIQIQIDEMIQQLDNLIEKHKTMPAIKPKILIKSQPSLESRSHVV